MIDRKRVILYIMSCVQQEHKTIRNARVAQLVERDLAKVEAAGSSPVSRSFLFLGFMRVPRCSEPAFNLHRIAKSFY